MRRLQSGLKTRMQALGALAVAAFTLAGCAATTAAVPRIVYVTAFSAAAAQGHPYSTQVKWVESGCKKVWNWELDQKGQISQFASRPLNKTCYVVEVSGHFTGTGYRGPINDIIVVEPPDFGNSHTGFGTESFWLHGPAPISDLGPFSSQLFPRSRV